MNEASLNSWTAQSFYRPHSASTAPGIVAKAYGDVTGDGKPDKVILTGITTADSPFVRNITLSVVEAGTSSVFHIPLPEPDGYQPTLFLGDFTGAGYKDILVQIDSGGSGAITYDNIYHYVEGKFKHLFNAVHFSSQWNYKVQYLDQYKLQVISGANGLSYTLDISGRGKSYLEQIYNPDGTLKKPVEGFVDPVSGLYPVDLDRNGQYSLLIFQQVSGLYHADSFGYILSVLSYDQGSWKLEQQWFASYGL